MKGVGTNASEPSTISIRWFTGIRSKCCECPLGHCTVARTAPSNFPTPKKISFECWATKPDPACKYFVWRSVPSFDSDRGTNRIAIARLPPQAERNRVTNVLHRVVQDPQLRRIAVFNDDLQPPVVVEIGQNKGTPVLNKVQSHHARNFAERAIAVVREHHISFIAIPGVVGSNQFVDCIPSMLVGWQRRGIFRRFTHHLPPEETARSVRSAAEMYPLAT